MKSWTPKTINILVAVDNGEDKNNDADSVRRFSTTFDLNSSSEIPELMRRVGSALLEELEK